MNRLLTAVALISAGAVIALGTIAATARPHRTVVVRRTGRVETVYIRNVAQQYISDKAIRREIPAWQHAVNADFARYWHTAQYRLVFTGRHAAPPGAINAVFVGKGPVKGALAYHTTENGAPSITVYAGTGDYYGFDNSVSFTHELFELAADPQISAVNQGWPYDYVWIEHANTSITSTFQYGVYGWFNEVSDPVEADSYLIDGVKISDFVTPAWFNDSPGSRYDFMGLCQQPFWLRPGGYAQFLDSNGWQILTNFRKGVAADRGFLDGDRRHR